MASLRGAVRSRAFVVFAALAFAWLARCTFDGLDAYDKGGDAATDAMGDVAAPDSGLDSGCSCGAGQACVFGQCETCSATWTLSHPAGVSVRNEALDTASNVLYVTAARSVGDAGATTGYLARVDSCTGKLIDAIDAPKIGTNVVPGLGEASFIGGKLFIRVDAPAGSPGGYARYDVATKTFEAMFSPLPAFSTGPDETWHMIAAAGGLWFSGSERYDQPDAALPVIALSDGNGGTCAKPLPLVGDEKSGRGIAASGNDVYQINTSNSAIVRHFDATQCSVSPCACAPTYTSGQYTITNNFMGAFTAVAVAQRLYFAGAAGVSVDLTDLEGFVSYYDPPSSQFAAAPYLYNKSTAQDGFLSIATDGTRLYAAGGHDIINFDISTAQGVVVVLDLSLSPVATLATPSVRPSGGIVPVVGGFIISGFGANASTPDGTARCTLQQCP